MRAVIQSGYGKPEAALSVQTIPVPEPVEDEVPQALQYLTESTAKGKIIITP